MIIAHRRFPFVLCALVVSINDYGRFDGKDLGFTTHTTEEVSLPDNKSLVLSDIKAEILTYILERYNYG